MKPLSKAVHDYLELRRGLGFKLVRHEAGLRDFVSFLNSKRQHRITVALALEWATKHANQQPAEWAARLSVVRGFARHWNATDPATEVPPQGLLPYRPRRAQPYFYSDQEIRQLLDAAKARCSIDPLRHWTYYCLFGLLAVTACGWERLLTFAMTMWTGLKESSPFGARSSGNRVWCRFIARPAEYLLITPSDGNTASVNDQLFSSLLTRTATTWTKARFIARSMRCPGKSDCVRWMRVMAPASMIFGIVLPFRRYCVGTEPVMIPNVGCQFCPLTLGMLM
jgi:hypothetical protein